MTWYLIPQSYSKITSHSIQENTIMNFNSMKKNLIVSCNSLQNHIFDFIWYSKCRPVPAENISISKIAPAKCNTAKL